MALMGLKSWNKRPTLQHCCFCTVQLWSNPSSCQICGVVNVLEPRWDRDAIGSDVFSHKILDFRFIQSKSKIQIRQRCHWQWCVFTQDLDFFSRSHFNESQLTNHVWSKGPHHHYLVQKPLDPGPVDVLSNTLLRNKPEQFDIMFFVNDS